MWIDVLHTWCRSCVWPCRYYCIISTWRRSVWCLLKLFSCCCLPCLSFTYRPEHRPQDSWSPHGVRHFGLRLLATHIYFTTQAYSLLFEKALLLCDITGLWQVQFNKNICTAQLKVLREHRPPPNASSSRIRIVIRNRLPDPDRDADRHQNVIRWSLGHIPALRKISSKSVDNSIIQWIWISDFGLLDPDGNVDRHQI